MRGLVQPLLLNRHAPSRAGDPATMWMLAGGAGGLRDFGPAAVEFFSNMRIPAALIAAAAIKDAFVLQSPPEDIKKSGSWVRGLGESREPKR